jgi:ABC-type glycerol-3-phosphate transport system substrate-binding protein
MWSPDPERETLNRRIFLSLAVAGAGGLGLPRAWNALVGGDEDDDPGRSAGQRPIQVYGGTDNNRSRKRILQVWGGRPRVHAQELTAEYRPIGDRSTDQIDHIRNLLAADPASADLLVVDAEYLPGLVAAGQVAEFPERNRDWLLNDLGCVGSVADRCVERDKVYAVPLNTDVPMLVFDDSRVTDQKALAGLGRRRGSDFWIAALALSQNRLLLQNGEYEGFTACLIELIAAFGKGGQPGTLPGEDALKGILDQIKQHFPAVLFDPDGTGDEEATFNAFQDGRAVAARMWPSQCHNLTRRVPGREAGAASYTVVPIPGGVLGGQVIAVGKHSAMRRESWDLAVYLAGAASQLQLNYNGGYVPTIGELYLDDQLRNDLYGIDDKQIDASTRRPVRTDYLQWSDKFREETRNYLLSR